MLDLMAYNFEVKIAGKHVTLKKYSKTSVFNYAVKRPSISVKRGESKNKRDNFTKSIMRARKKVFDTIACNVNCIPDYKGEIQRPKFLTLTFSENITNLQEANAEFTLFNKRLSYHLYKVRRNVLKYICIPEFQKRGAVHFHILYFNLPYVDFKELAKIWGQGYIFIEGIKEKNEIEDFAKYVSKYINKENSKGEDNYNLYLDKDMLNQKRYFVSRGLNKPEIYKLDINKEIYQMIIAQLKDFHSNNYEFENDFVGKIEFNNYEIDNNNMLNMIRKVVSQAYEEMKNIYSRKQGFNWEYKVKQFIKSFGHVVYGETHNVFSDKNSNIHEEMVTC